MQRLIRRIFEVKKWPSRILLFAVVFFVLDRSFPLPPEKPMSPVVVASDGSLMSAYLSEDDKWRMKTNVEDVPEELITAILAKEDRWFYYHPGVNPFAILRAAWSNVIRGKRVSGASTITMQVARMLEPKRRTWWSKIKEIFRAFQLEWHHSKEEILEMYLSYLPYGGNVEGVKASSFIYFDRPPSSLSLAQSVLMTVIPNRPNSLRLDTRKDKAREARNKWLKRFREDKIFPDNRIRIALYEPIESRRHQLIPKVPHLSRRLVDQEPAPEIRTTIVPEVQATAERLLDNYVRRVRAKGISNGAVLVVDNRTSAVLAYCGSADFFDHASAGQVDGVRAIRSPGSTLKPAVYAMAMDKGIYTPDSRMLDVPSTWNGYSPDNYDETFRGPVNLAYALRHSLNITAVRALHEAGYEDFLDLLQDAGFETIRKQREKLGLSVILGGCGVTLEELVRLFTAFSQKGIARPLAFVPEDTLSEGKRLFSPAAAWMIGDILSGIERARLAEPTDHLHGTRSGRLENRNELWKAGCLEHRFHTAVYDRGLDREL